MTQPEETPVSFIPSNFIEKGKILNGTFDIRNAIESIVLSLAIGIPVFHLPLGNLEVRQSSGRKATQETTFQRAKDKETPESRKNGRAFQSNGIGSPTV